MAPRTRVVVAMSGGVDSSVTAALLKERGFEVIGVSMRLWDYTEIEEFDCATQGSCCSPEDIHDARRVAEALDIPFYVMNMEEIFSKEVVDYFVETYMDGKTPNPCIKCNQVLKFEVLMKKALLLGADLIATGHYARIVKDGELYRLLKGVDGRKDQSYFLFTMTQSQLSRTLFPLGDLTKEDVREYARRLRLRTSDKKESQEICFVQDDSYHEFITTRTGDRPGEIVDTSGRVVGTHQGLFRYTVGQRRGLGLAGGPFYVVEIDTKGNRLVVGREGDLYSHGLTAVDVNWITPPRGQVVEDVTVKIRYRHPGVSSTIYIKENGVYVEFSTPQKAVTPGQAVVFYRGEEVLGGGWIERGG